MVTIRNLNAVAHAVLPPRQQRLQAAAMEYGAHGWGVIPGSACDGLTYTKGHTREKVSDLVPVLPSARTVRDVRAARSRWALAPYGILARAGEAFDVVEAPTWLAVSATGRREFRRHLCPVLIAPAGVGLLVQPGATLWSEFVGVRGIRLAEPETLVALPPTRVLHGHVTWWITPQQVQWQLGDADAVQAALLAVLAESAACRTDGAGGEARV